MVAVALELHYVNEPLEPIDSVMTINILLQKAVWCPSKADLYLANGKNGDED